MTPRPQDAPDQGLFHLKVAEEVRVLFARRQISAADVARALGWTDNYISRRLTGKIPFNVNELEAIAQALGVPVTSFFPEMIFDGGRVPTGGNNAYYSAPVPLMVPSPTCTFLQAPQPDPAEFSRAA